MKEMLIRTASELNSPSQPALDEFLAIHEQLAEKGNKIITTRPDFQKLVGPDNRQMAEDNNRNFARFMASLFSDYEPTVFIETVLWVFRAYRSHGFKTTYWPANLNLWSELLKSELSPDAYQSIYPFYNWLIINIPVFVKLSDRALSDFAIEDTPGH